MTEQRGNTLAAVYVQTNDATNDEVLAFERRPDGGLAPLGQFATGGGGTGKPRLPSQSSIVLSDDGRWLLVANAGTDDVSLFAVQNDGLRLSDRVASGGAVADQRRGQRQSRLRAQQRHGERRRFPDRRWPARRAGRLRSVAERRGCRSRSGGLQLDGRTLVVTKRGTDSIGTYAIDERGFAAGPTTIGSSGKTPYGFGFTADGAMIVTEAFGGAVGAACASSYSITDPGKITPVSGSVAGTRSEGAGQRSPTMAGSLT